MDIFEFHFGLYFTYVWYLNTAQCIVLQKMKMNLQREIEQLLK